MNKKRFREKVMEIIFQGKNGISTDNNPIYNAGSLKGTLQFTVL